MVEGRKMKITEWLKNLWQLLKAAAVGFHKHNLLDKSASLSYFTIFAVGPVMLVVIFVSNLFWERAAVEGSLVKHLKDVVGERTSLQIQDIIKNASITSHNFLAFISVVILIIVATGVYTDIQTSINGIWNLKIRKGRGFLQMVKNRIISFLIISGLGMLLLASLIINGLLEGFMDRLQVLFPHLAIVGIYIFNLFVTLVLVAALFAFIYKVMPDAFIKWKTVLPGSIFTAVLFMSGKFGITFYIKNTSIATSYGSAGSMILLLVWIFYSSVVLYYGAEFTKAYTLRYGGEIKPRPYATTVKVINVVSNAATIQENEAEAKT